MNNTLISSFIIRRVFALFFALLCSVFTACAQLAISSGKTSNDKDNITPTLPQGSIMYKSKIGVGTSGQTTGVLVFNNENSLFYYGRKDVDKPSRKIIKTSDTEFTQDIDDREGTSIFLGKRKNKLINREYVSFVNDYVLVEEEAPVFNWNITSETKTLGNRQVQKATTAFRGRQYVAWFAPDIPLSLGPWKFSGLPGLILEVHDTENLFSFEAISIDVPAKVLTPVVPPTQGQKVQGWEGYRNLVRTSAANYVKSIKARPGMSVDVHLEQWMEIVE